MESTNSILQRTIRDYLGWNEIDYNAYIYDMGLKYLEHYIPDESPLIIRQIVGSKIFWNWWKIEWMKRDQAFADSQVVRLKEAEMRMIYKELHNPESLAAELYPNGVVLRESYHNMMQELTKEEVSA